MNIAAFPTKGERTRAHIVATAARLFWHHNFHGVSVDQVAQAAEVNKATVYRYFADKRDLALAVVRFNANTTLDKFFSSTFEQFERPQDRLAEIYRVIHCAHLDMHRDNGDIFGCPILGLTLELGQDMPEIREEAERAFDRVETLLTEIARQAIAVRATPAEPATLGRTLMQLLHGALASARLARDPGRVLDAGHASLALIGFPEKRIRANEESRS